MDLPYGVLAEPLHRVAQRIDQLDEPRSEVGVARHRFGAQQRLALPGQGPAPVVGGVGGERAHQRAGAAFGAQIGVDEQRRVGGGQLEQPAHFGDDVLGGLGGLLFVDALAGFVDEQDVGVGAVAEFVAAEAADADDGEAGGQRVAVVALDGGAQGPGDGGGGEVGDGTADPVHEGSVVLLGRVVLRTVRADDVGRGGAEQLPAAHSAGDGDGGLGVLGAADGGQDLLLEGLVRTGLQAFGVAEQGHGLGGAHQQVGGEASGGQNAGEVLGGGALVAQQAQVPGGLAEGVGDLAEVQQAGCPGRRSRRTSRA